MIAECRFIFPCVMTKTKTEMDTSSSSLCQDAACYNVIIPLLSFHLHCTAAFSSRTIHNPFTSEKNSCLNVSCYQSVSLIHTKAAILVGVSCMTVRHFTGAASQLFPRQTQLSLHTAPCLEVPHRILSTDDTRGWIPGIA